MIDNDYYDEGRDLLTVREFAFDKNKIIAERRDPFGFWHLHLHQGNLPDWMKGAYTSIEEAKKHINLYLEQKGKTVKQAA